MRILQILVLCCLFVGFYTVSQAQICGPSKTKIYAKDSNGNFLADAKIQLLGLNQIPYSSDKKWLSYKDNAYVIYFDDFKPSGKKLLRISLKGFETIEKQIQIKEAQNQIFDVVLRRKNTNEQTKFDELLTFWGRVSDKNSGAISNAKIVLINEINQRFESKSNIEGEYLFEILEGNYKIEVVGSNGFAPLAVEKYFVSKETNHLDFKLEVDLSKVVVTQLVCSPHKYLANHFDCVFVCKYPVENK
jgi:hypothetical protein